MFFTKREPAPTPRTVESLIVELAIALNKRAYLNGQNYTVTVNTEHPTLCMGKLAEVKTKFEKTNEELKRQVKALRQRRFNSRRAMASLQKAFLLMKAHRDNLLKEVQELRPLAPKKVTEAVYRLVHECACHIAEKENGAIVQSDFVMERLQKMEALCKTDVPAAQIEQVASGQ